MENTQDQDVLTGFDIGNDVAGVEMGPKRRVELQSLPGHTRLPGQQAETGDQFPIVPLCLSDAECRFAVRIDCQDVVIGSRR